MSQHSASSKTWLFLSIEGRRQYGGNTGYADVSGEVYRFDSLVANARHVAVGDGVVFRDRSGGTGFARIESITKTDGSKEILRCPVCAAAQIKERSTIHPRFRCKNKHEFDTPKSETRSCIKYEARFGDTFVPATPTIPPEMLRGACQRFNGQLSIQRISVGILAPVIARNAIDAVNLLGLEGWELRGADAWDIDLGGDSFEPHCRDEREKVIRQIRARRGQKQFRDALLQRYRHQCLISGCELVDVIEAAHIHPFRSEADNHLENGLLLRCDLHTLFDLDLLGVEPSSLEVHIDERAAECGYLHLAGVKLRCPDLRPSEVALEFRWQLYCARQAAVASF